MLIIKNIKEIKQDLFENGTKLKKFPKSLNYPFDKLYIEVVTQIPIIEISSECILFNSTLSFNETRDLSDPAYWGKNYSKDEIAKFWIFGKNGQGDLWVFDTDNKVYFYDHNQEKMSKKNFINMGINFSKWLQFAYLNKQIDTIYETKDKLYFDKNGLTTEVKKTYKKKLNELSKTLLKNYPFYI